MSRGRPKDGAPSKATVYRLMVRGNTAHHLADRFGMTRVEFWKRYGAGLAARARREIRAKLRVALLKSATKGDTKTLIYCARVFLRMEPNQKLTVDTVRIVEDAVRHANKDE